MGETLLHAMYIPYLSYGAILELLPIKQKHQTRIHQNKLQGYAVHPLYNKTEDGSAAFNDVAVMQIVGQSQQPYVNVSTTIPPKGQSITAIGWGYTDVTVNQGDGGISSETLMYVDFLFPYTR